MYLTIRECLAYLSGMAGGFVVSWYWLIRPMGRLLGFERESE